MNHNTLAINKEKLLKEANQIIQEHEDYITGMCVTAVVQKGNILVFQGESFLDDNGLPSNKSTAAFNMFKYLTQLLSKKYHLND